MATNEKDNFWLKFLDYKKLRDEEILFTVEALNEIINSDNDFLSIVTLNPNHPHYESMKEIVEALQIYHSSTIQRIIDVRDTLSADINVVY